MRTCWRVLVASALTVLFAGQDVACAASKTVMIGRRDGGQLLRHIHQAVAMTRSGYSYRIVGDQYSAAAMQVLYLESRVPARICATQKARLHLHLGKDHRTGKSMRRLGWISIKFIGRRNIRRLGRLPDYGKGYKTVKASDFVGLCRGKTISCNVAWCGE
jgi:hypothetical protein